MPRKKAVEVQTEIADQFNDKIAEAVALDNPERITPDQFLAPIPNTETAQEHDATQPDKEPFVSVRGWSERFVHPVKYRVLTDANVKVAQHTNGAIIIQLDLPKGQYVPSAEIQKIFDDNKKDYYGKPTGLKFTTLREHGKAWVLPNDREGRAVQTKIEMGLKAIATKMEAEPAEGQTR